MKNINNLKDVIMYYCYSHKPVIVVKNGIEQEISNIDNIANENVFSSCLNNGILTVWM